VPGTRQRCLARRARNLLTKVPEAAWPEFKARALACYQAPLPDAGRLLRDDGVTRYERELPSAVACFTDDFEARIAQLRFPITHRRSIRTTNLLERLFDEERRRMKVVANTFGERPVLKLMYASLIRGSERWRGRAWPRARRSSSRRYTPSSMTPIGGVAGRRRAGPPRGRTTHRVI